MNLSIPDSKFCFNSIISTFYALETEYNYKIISSTIEKYNVRVVYENKNIGRKIEMRNETNYTDYGFSIFIYNMNIFNGEDYNIIVNIPFAKEDKNCNFIKKTSVLFFKSCHKMIKGTKWKRFDKILYQW